MHGLMGSFSLMPLQEVLEFLARRRLTGTITCERGAVRKSCHAVDGVVVESESNDPREYLGQLLVNFGHITEEGLARAFELQGETKQRLGKVLVTLGLASGDAVRDALAFKIRETLLDAVRWESGLFRVETGPARPGDELEANVPLADIAREAEFRGTAWQAFRGAFPAGDAVVELDDGGARTFDRASLTGRIVALARERRTVDEIALALRMTDFHLHQRLYALFTQGVLRAAPQPSAPDAPADAAAALDLARSHLAASRLEEAEAAAERAVALDPSLGEAKDVRERARAALATALRARLLDPPRTPRSRVASHDIATLPVSATERWLLARCDGTRDAAALVRLAPAPEVDVLRSLRRLVDQRLLTLQ